ncbi:MULTISPECIES: bacillithiol system redox-active protein YtxJ [Flavobacteriaceae]|uniref:bacillithiol system redox-active protein YtxJ n=1 Tax=Flavobacteriaceae TaxID=49546 RepID=UPI001492E2B5|nr:MULTISPECIES: bacillithiol system redox-active protein YtxJ [Allomuricauda]MDC6364935.1 bacillithiol system redox-active protein YtxJ [Muricauda sp. AC10]
MGIFGGFFGKKEGEEHSNGQIPWIPLVSMDQLAVIKEKSKETPQLIFKHSTTCGISSMVLRMFSGKHPVNQDAAYYFLDLHANRDVSNAVESEFQVLHQSPQLLIINDGEVTFHTSHGAIADADLEIYM